eukprot:scaffold154936_cov30-Tisochrysis_lutea.AAC.2
MVARIGSPTESGSPVCRLRKRLSRRLGGGQGARGAAQIALHVLAAVSFVGVRLNVQNDGPATVPIAASCPLAALPSPSGSPLARLVVIRTARAALGRASNGPGYAAVRPTGCCGSSRNTAIRNAARGREPTPAHKATGGTASGGAHGSRSQRKRSEVGALDLEFLPELGVHHKGGGEVEAPSSQPAVGAVVCGAVGKGATAAAGDSIGLEPLGCGGGVRGLRGCLLVGGASRFEHRWARRRRGRDARGPRVEAGK